MRQPSLGLVVLASLILSGGCGSDAVTGPKAGSIVVTPDSVNIVQLDSVRLDVSVLDDHGDLLTGAPVNFTSSDTSRLKVSAIGEVVSTGRAGNLSVTLKTGGITKVLPVIVTAVPGSITITPSPATAPQNGTVQLHAVVLDISGQPVANPALTFTSQTPAIATVSGTGLVRSVGPSGTAFIQVDGAGVTNQVGVVITQVATSLRVTPTTLRMAPHLNSSLSVTVLDAVGTPIPGPSVTFHSDNSALVTVSGAGVVHSVGPLGTTLVEVSSAGFQDTVTVTVLATSHPLGTIASTSHVEGVAIGPAISASGVVYVAQLFGQYSRADLPAFTFHTVQSLPGQPFAVAFNPAGTRAYLAGAPGDGISVIDPATDSVIGTVTGLQATVFDVVVSHDGQTIYVATDNHVYAIDATSLTVVHTFDTDRAMIHLALHPSQPLLYASGLNQVTELNSQTLASVRSLPVGSLVQGVAVSNDGTTLYEADEDGHLRSVILASGAAGPTIDACTGYSVAMSIDGLMAYMSCPGQGKVVGIDLSSGTITQTITTTGSPRRMAFNATGLTLAVANEGGWVDFIQ